VPAPEWRIEPLERRHDRGRFSCGDESLDAFLKRFARANARQNTARTFVLVEPGETRVWGYYALSMTSIDGGELPEGERRGLPRVVPAALIGRFAVDEELQGRGLGRTLLFDALQRIRLAAQGAAAFCVVVHAVDQRAADFYLRYGFRELADHPLHLFVPLREVDAMFT